MLLLVLSSETAFTVTFDFTNTKQASLQRVTNLAASCRWHGKKQPLLSGAFVIFIGHGGLPLPSPLQPSLPPPSGSALQELQVPCPSPSLLFTPITRASVKVPPGAEPPTGWLKATGSKL